MLLTDGAEELAARLEPAEPALRLPAAPLAVRFWLAELAAGCVLCVLLLALGWVCSLLCALELVAEGKEILGLVVPCLVYQICG